MGKRVDKMKRIGKITNFTNISFYILLTFKQYTNSKTENKLRHTTLFVHRTRKMTTN